MGIWFIILVSFIPAVYFIWKIYRLRHQGNAVPASDQQQASQSLTVPQVFNFNNNGDDAPVSPAGATTDDEWWNKLNSRASCTWHWR
ncbi:MAG: hypothetical protein WKI04_04440 [Ferruginibacter sp.]